MVRGQWSVDSGSRFVDFTDGQSSVIFIGFHSSFYFVFSFSFFSFFFTEQSVLHFFFLIFF